MEGMLAIGFNAYLGGVGEGASPSDKPPYF